MSSTNSTSSPGSSTTPSEPPRATSTPDTSGAPGAMGTATEAAQAADAGTGSGTAAPVGAASSSPDSTDTVWSAGTTTLETTGQSPGRVQGSTLLWGAVLLLVGGLLVATGLGVSLDPTTTAIVCLGGIGVMLVILALVPRRTGQG